jgi:hypothetical protein
VAKTKQTKLLQTAALAALAFAAATQLNSRSSSAHAAGSAWYEGGTLHKTTLKDWKKGSDENRLATSADWAAVAPLVKRKMAGARSMNDLLPYAYGMLRCVDEVAKAKEAAVLATKSQDAALGCIVFMEWTE